MKQKMWFVFSLVLFVIALFVVNYGQGILTDCVGAVIGLAGGSIGGV